MLGKAEFGPLSVTWARAPMVVKFAAELRVRVEWTAEVPKTDQLPAVSVPPFAWVTVPVTFNVPLRTSTRPVLLSAVLMDEVPVPVDLRRRPALRKVSGPP